MLILELAGTHFQRFCGYFCRLPRRRLEDKRLPTSENKRLSFRETLVTVLVRCKVTFYVSLAQPLSLRKLCVAHSRAKGAFNENSSGFILRLRSIRPTCVYASCHAQRCARSRTVRPSRRSYSVSPALWHPQGTGPLARGQASQKVALSQGASVWGRLAH
jgi:hypothetical protein